MKPLLIISLMTIFVVQAQAQRSSIGLRGGGLSGISYKHIEEQNLGFELMFGSQEGGLRFTGLVEKHKEIMSHHFADLYYYSGIGAHSGYIRYENHEWYEYENVKYYHDYHETRRVFGGDVIIGAELRIHEFPIAMSLDYKPYFEIFGEKPFRVDLWDFGFTVSYVFNNKKS